MIVPGLTHLKTTMISRRTNAMNTRAKMIKMRTNAMANFALMKMKGAMT